MTCLVFRRYFNRLKQIGGFLTHRNPVSMVGPKSAVSFPSAALLSRSRDVPAHGRPPEPRLRER